jgi:cell division protease FtsH
MKSKNAQNIIIWLVIFAAVVYFTRILGQIQPEEDIKYSDFKQFVNENRVTEITIRTDLIRGKYKTAEAKPAFFKTVPVPDTKLVEDLDAHNVKYSGEAERGWITGILTNVGWLILFFVIWYFIIRQLQGGGKQAIQFGRSKAKLVSVKKTKVTFEDVAGCDEAKEELKEIIEFLKEPAKFQKLGGKIPKGVILYGAPGTGKTLLAKAVAGEAVVPFFSASGSEFVEMFVGVGASRVRDLFEQGKKSAPCLLFIDEIDAVGRHRFAGIGGGHDEREQTLNQLLVEMDGFDTKEGVILIAATNRPDVLDPALLRAGRFDRHIVVPTPDLKGREQILKVHARGVKLAKEVNLTTIARRTPGFVGADLANLINEAALLAARKSKAAVEMPELEEAIDRVIAGPERKSHMISEKEKRIVAYHESGHALVAKLTPGSDPVHKVSIIPRGPALGYTLQLPTEDRYLVTRTEIIGKITSLLGGRTAEELIFSEITTGAQNDLQKATDFAVRMVTEYGMSEKLGPLTLRKREEEIFLGRDIMQREKLYSEKTAQLIDEEVRNIIKEAETRAAALLKNNKQLLEKLAETLIEKEILEGEEVNRLLGLPPEVPAQEVEEPKKEIKEAKNEKS